MNKRDAEQEIITAIESGGAAAATEFDLDRVFALCYRYAGNGQYECKVDPDEFWLIVKDSHLPGEGS
jgi:hypothetical protein